MSNLYDAVFAAIDRLDPKTMPEPEVWMNGKKLTREDMDKLFPPRQPVEDKPGYYCGIPIRICDSVQDE